MVVGGGRVGERKVRGLLDAGFSVRLISPVATEELEKMADAGAITWLAREVGRGDLAGAFLVFASTDQREVNRAVADEARALGLLCNVADAPHEGDFHLPALLRRADATVAVGSGGVSPTHAKSIRDRIRRWLDAEEPDSSR